MNEKCWYKNVCENECTNCIRYSEMKYLIDNSGIPEARQYPQSLEAGKDYASFVKLANIKDNIVSLVESKRFNLYICSKETGNGKTSWAIKILLKYFDSVWAGNGFRVRGLFVHVPTLLLRLKNFNNPITELEKNNLNNADIICWDDIVATKLTEYDIMQLLMLIDQRILLGKTNIYTGNLTNYASLEKAVGSRLASRIWNCSQIVEFKGKDRRNGPITDIE